MQYHRLVVCIGLILIASLGFSTPRALAATPPFSITATNVTMPSTGPGITHYSVADIPLTGTLAVSCTYMGSPEDKAPICNYGPLRGPVQVTAGQTVTGTIDFYPYGSAIPAGLRRESYAPWGGLALAGMLLLGLGFRRGTRSRLLLTVLAAGFLAGVVGISACGGSSSLSTPGTYQYTISADNESGGVTPLGQGVSTVITVTVP
jgi:hypothetical protein